MLLSIKLYWIPSKDLNMSTTRSPVEHCITMMVHCMWIPAVFYQSLPAVRHLKVRWGDDWNETSLELCRYDILLLKLYYCWRKKTKRAPLHVQILWMYDDANENLWFHDVSCILYTWCPPNFFQDKGNPLITSPGCSCQKRPPNSSNLWNSS